MSNFKNCTKKDCKQINPQDISKFYKDKTKKTGYRGMCSKCDIERLKLWKLKNPHGDKNNKLMRCYNINIDQYKEMVKTQNGLCYICKNKESMFDKKMNGIRHLSVDHDHQSNLIRKLLCSHCNKGLGCFKDSPKLLRFAADYIELHNELEKIIK